MGESLAQNAGTERKYLNEPEYPFGYFDAQVEFARRWSEISGIPLADAIVLQTSLAKRILQKTSTSESLADMMSFIKDVNATEVAHVLYSKYLELPSSLYVPPEYPDNDGKHFGFFAFDYYPANPQTNENSRIKVHFINRYRGERSGLDEVYLDERQEDVKRMFRYIRNTYPQARDVIGGSWLYNLPSYRKSYPPAFVENLRRLVPMGFEHIPSSIPRLSFGGDSVWGQFLDRRGSVRPQIVAQFLENLQRAESSEELINAFPNFTYQPKAPIEVFYDWIGYRG